jgi:predicted TIM-barrel fold metal-dependent hydrolase
MPVEGIGPVVDADGHLVTDMEAIALRMPPEFREIAQGGGLGRLFPPPDHFHSAQPVKLLEGSFEQVGVEGWLNFMADVGIDFATVFPTGGLSYGLINNRDWAIAACQGYNDWLHDTYLSASDSFVGVGLIPIQDPEMAVLELRRIVRDLGMAGAMLPTSGIPNHLGAKEYWPIYEEADRLGCCLAVHGGSHSGYGLDRMNVYAPVHALGHPMGLMNAFAGVIFNGVMDKYPNARWGFLEGGISWLLLCLERFDRSWETHVNIDPRGELIQLRKNERISDYIARHIDGGRIFVGCEGPEPMLSHMVNTIGDGFPMFSSDFPHEVNAEMCRREIGEVAANDDLSQGAKEAILRKNAERFFGLSERFAKRGV